MKLPRYLLRSRPLQAWLLAALLLVAQGLGLAHRVAHAPGLGQAGAQACLPAPGHVHGHVHGHLTGHLTGHVPGHVHGHAQAHASAFWAAGHEADTAECRLIDQLAHADGLCDAAWAAAPAPQVSVVANAAPAAAPRAGSASAYLARAPPLA